MLFSSVTFLYWFLPAVLAVYFALPVLKGGLGLRNVWLLLASLIFYAWGEPKYILLMAAQCVAGWGFGLLIERFRGGRLSLVFFVTSLILSLSGLLFYKYADFFIANVNAVSGLQTPLLNIALPIGISFYTFQIVSYTVDVYAKKTDVQRNPLTFSTYVALFPQLIAGPIVRYSDVADALTSRKHSLEDFSKGARRFIVGLAKKVLIANVLGELAEKTRATSGSSTLSAWLYIIAYTLHIYFDFSGYSDMAIGLGRIFGFKFPENFNYPYAAKSVTDFWRRWHMSLSSWFRDYVYIPLGGNRRGLKRQLFNILVVWLLTGFWHGAAWNFIGWGLYFAVLLSAEKFALGKLLNRLPAVVGHLYLLLIVMLGWVLFDAQSFSAGVGTIASMFTPKGSGGEALYYLRSYAVPLSVGIIGATPLPKKLFERVENHRAMAAFEPVAAAFLLVAVTAFLVDGSFNPFIYFRF